MSSNNRAQPLEVIVTIKRSDREEAVDYVILADDLPAISKACWQAVNNRVAHKHQSATAAQRKAETPIERAVRLVVEVYPNAHPTDDLEAELIEDTLSKYQGRGAVMNDDYSKAIIKQCFKVDTATNRLISEGYVIFNREAIFERKEDAIRYLNQNGFKCTNFIEAFKAWQRGEITACWHENFIDTYVLVNVETAD